MIDTCWGYISGYCIFGDQTCWFRHSPSISSDIQCKLCNESFRTKHEYKKHQKQKHATEVPICKDFASRNCKRGDKFCWFKHEKTEEFEQEHNNYVEQIEKDKVMERLFDLIEKVTDRMNKFEEDNKKENKKQKDKKQTNSDMKD